MTVELFTPTVRAVCFDVFGTLIAPPLNDPFRRLLAPLPSARRRTLRQRWLESSYTWAQACQEADAPGVVVEEGGRDLAELCATLVLLPQARRALEVCRHRGWKTAVASNLASAYVPAVQALVAPAVDVLAWSCERGWVKPDVRLFQCVEQAWGLAGGCCMMVGDSPVSDMAVGADLGWHTWLIEGAPGASLDRWCNEAESGWKGRC